MALAMPFLLRTMTRHMRGANQLRICYLLVLHGKADESAC